MIGCLAAFRRGGDAYFELLAFRLADHILFCAGCAENIKHQDVAIPGTKRIYSQAFAPGLAFALRFYFFRFCHRVLIGYGINFRGAGNPATGVGASDKAGVQVGHAFYARPTGLEHDHRFQVFKKLAAFLQAYYETVQQTCKLILYPLLSNNHDL